MAQIVVILREHHGNWYQSGELVRMSKDCFYMGLLPKNCPMVVHLKDQPHTMPLDLLKALLEQAENHALKCTRYPQSMSARPNAPSKLEERYHWQYQADKRNNGYAVCPTQLDAKPVEVAPEADFSPTFADNGNALERWYNDGFLISLRQAAEISEYCNGRCFNCQKEGHHWCQCKEPLSLEIQELVDKQDKEHKECNNRGPGSVDVHKDDLGIWPISELDYSLNLFGHHISLVGLGGHSMEPIGFTLVCVQIEGMPHYDEQQVTFILDDPSRFSARIPVILGTPTINRVIQILKESDIHDAPMEWQAARVVYEWMQSFQFCQAVLGEGVDYPTNTAWDPTDLDEKVLLTDNCIVPGFQSVVVHGRTQNTMMMGHCLNVLTQVPSLSSRMVVGMSW